MDYSSFLCSSVELRRAAAIYEEYFNHLQKTHGYLDYRILPGAKTVAYTYQNMTRNPEKATKLYIVI
jgi:hypothetical protein